MSKLAFKASDAGSGTFTLTAPQSNTDYNIALPEKSGIVMLTSDFVADNYVLKTDYNTFKGTMKTSISAINTSLGNKADKTYVDELVDEKIGSIDFSSFALKTEVSTVDTNLRALITALTERVTALETANTNLTARMGTAETNITTAQNTANTANSLANDINGKYYPKTGGTISGNVDVTGRAKAGSFQIR